MNGKIFLIILALCCADNVFAQKENVGTGIAKIEKGTKEITQLKEAMQRFDNALMMANTEELKRLLSDKLEMVHSNGMVETKETLLKNIETKRLVYKIIVVGDDCKTAMVGGETATITRDLDVTGILEDNEFDVKLNTRENWVWENGDWKLIKRESKNRE